jgi:hypothetical protein
MAINLNEICDCCGGAEQSILQLFNDKCFRIVTGKDTSEEFCLKDFAYPVDGHTCVGLNVTVDGEITLFDNQVGAISPSGILESGKEYARAVLVRVSYPINDINGDEILFSDKSVRVFIENAETLESLDHPMYDFFTIFTNPKSNKSNDLINKIKIINPNLLYTVRVTALVLFGVAD